MSDACPINSLRSESEGYAAPRAENRLVFHQVPPLFYKLHASQPKPFPIPGRPVSFSPVAYLVKAPRVGRSQGAVIFWGLVSAFFASAFCYYYLKNRTNEESARQAVEQVSTLQDQKDALTSERDKIEATTSDTQKQLQARADFLQQKETKLAEEEADLDALSAGGHASPSQAQAGGVKRFDDAAHKIAAAHPGAEVSQLGGGPCCGCRARCFLRWATRIFSPKAVRSWTPRRRPSVARVRGSKCASKRSPTTRADRTRMPAGGTAKKDDTDATGMAAAPAKTHYANAWDLTAAQAASIERYLHDQGMLPFQNVLVMGRGDFLSGEGGGKDGHAHNRLVEITLTPAPPPFHAADSARNTHGKSGGPSLAPPPDQGAP